MQAESTRYVKGWFVAETEKGRKSWQRCDCGAKMIPTVGKKMKDGDFPRLYLWFVCKDDPTHITEPDETSEAFWSAFQKTF